ncbi:MAG: thioredoxin family protein [Leptospiraceae bacterium]|nr:thioredoxin family protein [Leptospiraceae bacterium]
MKNWILFISLFMVTTLFLYPSDNADSWERDLQKAKKIAQKSGKLIFVDVGTSWCGFCDTLKKEVFPTKSFQDQAKNYVLVRLDGDKDEQLMDKLKVNAYPTLIYFQSNGKEIDRTNYLDAKNLSKKMALLHQKHGMQYGRRTDEKSEIKPIKKIKKIKVMEKHEYPNGFRRHVLNKCQILPEGYSGN